MPDSQGALQWLAGILEKHKIPYQISGGMAAKIYGSPRPLNDVDIDIPNDRFGDIFEEIKPYIIFGPDRYVDERWDLLLATLNYKGQEIDISGVDDIKICDARTGNWQVYPFDLKKVEMKEVYGLKVPVINPKDLVNYKSMLIGDHQKIDIEAVKKYV